MPSRWDHGEEKKLYRELRNLYVTENRSIGDIARLLGMGQSSIYARLLRLGIKPQPSLKPRYRNRNAHIRIPKRYSEELAEFIGIMLGDGHLTATQVMVTLGKKELSYVEYIISLIERLFAVRPKYCISSRGDLTVYLGSTEVVRWLQKMGLVFNKVALQVRVPAWCGHRLRYMRRVVRGLIDTDGSVYRLRFGMQISFCNRSIPLLKSARSMLISLGFHPSRISGFNIYLTRAADLIKYKLEVGFKNPKHEVRFMQYMGGSDSGNSIAL